MKEDLTFVNITIAVLLFGISVQVVSLLRTVWLFIKMNYYENKINAAAKSMTDDDFFDPGDYILENKFIDASLDFEDHRNHSYLISAFTHCMVIIADIFLMVHGVYNFCELRSIGVLELLFTLIVPAVSTFYCSYNIFDSYVKYCRSRKKAKSKK